MCEQVIEKYSWENWKSKQDEPLLGLTFIFFENSDVTISVQNWNSDVTVRCQENKIFENLCERVIEKYSLENWSLKER